MGEIRISGTAKRSLPRVIEASESGAVALSFRFLAAAAVGSCGIE